MIGLALSGSPGSGAFPSFVVLRERTLLVRDVIDTTKLPDDLAGRVSRIALFDMPVGRSEIRLDDRSLERLIRLRAPVLAKFMPPSSGASIVIRSSRTTPATFTSDCLVANTAMAHGGAVRSAQFERSRCSRRLGGLVRYDVPTRTYRLRRDLKPGDIVPAIPGALTEHLVPGDRFEAITTVGSVTVTRTVEALQSAEAGEPLFVRDSEGQIYAARQERRQ